MEEIDGEPLSLVEAHNSRPTRPEYLERSDVRLAEHAASQLSRGGGGGLGGNAMDDAPALAY